MAKQTTYDYVLWDWNGTLFNDIDACINSINKSLQGNNLPLMTRERYLDLFCFPVEKYYQKLGFDFNKSSYAELAKEYIDNFLVESKSIALLHDGVKEILDYIQGIGIKQSILSASEKEILIERLEFYDIKKYFDEIMALDNIYAESKIELGTKWINSRKGNEKIVLIGDSPHDYEVASAMKIDCILFTGGHSPKEKLKKTKAVIVDDLCQIKEYIYEEKTATVEEQKCGCC